MRIIRSVVYKGKSKEQTVFPGLHIQVKDRARRKTYVKPNLPEWSLPTIEDAVEKFREAEKEENSFLYKKPVLHLIRVRKSKRENKKAEGSI